MSPCDENKVIMEWAGIFVNAEGTRTGTNRSRSRKDEDRKQIVCRNDPARLHFGRSHRAALTRRMEKILIIKLDIQAQKGHYIVQKFRMFL